MLDATRYLYGDLLLFADNGAMQKLEDVIDRELSLCQILDLLRASKLLNQKLEEQRKRVKHAHV